MSASGVFGIVLIGSFVLLLIGIVVLGVLAFRAFARGGASSSGPAQALLGCGLAASLGCLGLCVLIAFAIVAALLMGRYAVNRAVEVNPFERVTIRRDVAAEPLELDDDRSRPLHLIFRVRGDRFRIDALRGLIEELSDGELAIETRDALDDAGLPIVEIDVALPADRNDLEDLERRLRERWPDVDFGEGVEIEFTSAQRDV